MQPLPQGRMPLGYSVQQQQGHYLGHHESSYPASQVYAHSPSNYQPPPTAAPLQQLGIQAQIAVQPMHHHHSQSVSINGYGQAHSHPQYMSPTSPTSHIHHQQHHQQHIYRQSHESPQHGNWNHAPRYQPHPTPTPIHLSPLDAYLLARALQTAVPQQEQQQIYLFAQANGKQADLLIRAYEQNRQEINQLVAQLRVEEAALIAQQQHQQHQQTQQTSPQITSAAPTPANSQPAAISTPTSASATQQSFKREPSMTDVTSEASSPMLETPTSASLPTATKSGSRDGEPYSEAEIRLIEQVIREAVQKQPDIKLAQLGVLIHQKDQARPATAWARQLSKRKQAIDRARELSKNGKDISRFPIEVNRKGRQHVETDTDGEGSPSKAADDAEYDDRPHKRRRAS